MTTALNITVKTTAGRKFEMQVEALSETVLDFKKRLSVLSSIPAEAQRLIYRGRILTDQLTFQEIQQKHGLESGHSMHVVAGPSAARSSSTPSNENRSQSSSSTSSSAAHQNAPDGGTNPHAARDTTGSGNTPSQNPTPNPFLAGAGTGVDGLAGLGGIPNFQDMHAQLLQNPEQMQAMLNNPLMESIINNPDVIRSFVMTNPQMRQLLENNPEVAHVFNDPATFRQMMQMARNPSLMQEAMRNTDRQMANIEMMPGGFDALRRMHENIQTPLYDGFANAMNPNNNQGNQNQNGPDSSNNPFSSLFQQNTPSNTPMPNPWAVPGNTNTTRAPNTFGGGNDRPMNVPNTGGIGNPFAAMFQTRPAGSGVPTGNEDGTDSGASANTPLEPGAWGGLNSANMMQMLENPAMQQMMQQLLADPNLMRTMVESNPQLRTLMQSQPQLAAMLQNPELLRTMLNPEVLRATRQLQEALGRSGSDINQLPGFGSPFGMGTGGETGPTTTPATGNAPSTGSGTDTGAGNGSFDGWARAFREINAATGIGGTGGAQGPEPTREQLLEMYGSQLVQLRDMGFLDEGMCLQALRQARGDVSLAIENLLNRFGR